MSELFNEIEDDLKRERFERLWQNFSKLMVAISVFVVFITIVVVVEQNHAQSRAMEQTTLFIQGNDLFTSGDYNGAIAVFSELADDDSSPYYGMAMLRRAEAQDAGGDKAGAALSYKALAAHDKVFGELAKMQLADAIAPNRASPFYSTQSEWKGWQLIHAGKKEEAVAQFIALRDAAETPYSMRQRMHDVVQQLAPEKALKENAVKENAVNEKQLEDKN